MSEEPRVPCRSLGVPVARAAPAPSPYLAGMLEELAEASLFDAWLRSGTLLPRDAPALLGGALTPSEYLGGVCDLVGEVGRYAVRRATERDVAAVRESLDTAMAVQTAMLLLAGALPVSYTHLTLPTICSV